MSTTKILEEFAIKVNREVNIRCGRFKPNTGEERQWRAEGVCSVMLLQSVREHK